MSFFSKSHRYLVHTAARIFGMPGQINAIPTASDAPDPSMGLLWFVSQVSHSVERDHRFISTVNIFPPMAGSSDALLSSHPYTVADFRTVKALNTPLTPSGPDSSGVEHEALLFHLVRVDNGIDPEIWVGMHRGGRGAHAEREKPAQPLSLGARVVATVRSDSDSDSSGPYDPAKDRVVFNSSRGGALQALGSSDTNWHETRAYSYAPTLPPSPWPGPLEAPPYISAGTGVAPTVLHILALGFTYSRALPQYDLFNLNCYTFADAITHCLINIFPSCERIPKEEIAGTFKGKRIVQTRHEEMWAQLPHTSQFVANFPLQRHTLHLQHQRDAAEEAQAVAVEAQAVAVEAQAVAEEAQAVAEEAQAVAEAKLAERDIQFAVQARELEDWKRRALANEAGLHNTAATASRQ